MGGASMNIKVGETWRTRGGWLAEVIYELNGNDQPFVVIHAEDGTQCVESHHRNGKFAVDGKCSDGNEWDLVSRVEPKPLADQLDELFSQIAAAGHGVPGSVRLVEEVRALEGGVNAKPEVADLIGEWLSAGRSDGDKRMLLRNIAGEMGLSVQVSP